MKFIRRASVLFLTFFILLNMVCIEVPALGADPQINLIGKLSASSEASGYEVQYAVDNDSTLSTDWCAGVGDSGANIASDGLPYYAKKDWIRVDLGCPYLISKYELATICYNFGSLTMGATDFQLQGSNIANADGNFDNDWTNIDTKTGNTSSNISQDVSPSVAYRYYRLLVTKTRELYQADINDFKLYGVSVPTISSITPPANGSYKTGSALDITVGFSDAVTVNDNGGTTRPYIPITLATGGPARAYYCSGSGSTNLVFRYTVEEGQKDEDGIALSSPIMLNGGTIRNFSAIDAGLDFSLPNTSGIIIGVNAVPEISNLNGDSVAYTEGGSPVLFDSGNDTTVTDSDNPNFDGGNVTASIIANRVSAEDVLSIVNEGTDPGQIGLSASNVTYGGTKIGTYAGGTGNNDLVITLDTDATPTAVSALIKALTYSNTNSTDPSTSTRTIRVTVNDGEGGTSSNADVTVNVTAVNEVPFTRDITSFLQLGDHGGAKSANGSYATGQIDNITLEAWIYLENTTGAHHAFFNGNGATSGYGFYVSGQTVNILMGSVGWIVCSSGASYNVSNNAVLTAGQWTHIAATRNTGDGGTDGWKIYVNGKQMATQFNSAGGGSGIPNPLNATSYVQIGSSAYDPAGLSVSEARIWTRALTQAEILANISGTVATNASGLAGYWKLTDGLGTVITDIQTNKAQLNLPITGPITWVASTAASTAEDTAICGQLAGGDVETSVTYAKASDPVNGTVTVNVNGSYTYTPAANFNGSDNFTFVTNDGSINSASRTVYITVTPVNDAPTITSGATENFTEGGTGTVYTATATDPESDTITWSIGGTDAGLFDIDSGTGALTFKVAPDFEVPVDNGGNNVYDVTIIATDNGAGNLTANKAVAITVTNLNDAPTVTSGATANFAENATGTVYTATGTDPEVGDTLSWSISGTDSGLFDINNSTGVLTFKTAPNFESPADSGANNVYDLTITATDNGTGNLTATKTIAITVTNVNEAPIISTGTAISVTEGSTTAFTAAGADPEGSVLSWSITGGADQAKFGIVSGTGVVTFGTAPSFGAPTDADAHNDYVLEITASDGTSTAVKTVTVTVTKQVSSGGGSSGSTTSSLQPVVVVNGQKQDAGTANTQTTGGQTVTTIKVDDTKLNKLLETSGEKPTVALPTNQKSDVVVGELNGQTVKNMEQKEAVLEIKTETVSYTLPAAQINIDDVSSQIGEQVALKDIKVSVKIAEPSADTVKIVENTAAKNSYQIVVKPVDFEITCTSGNKTVGVSKFNGYVERTVAIPDGIDHAKITTGIVLNSDGTFSHVPTTVIKINGKYFAKINSLTNSTYSVIYNPVEFKDVANHWAKNAINDMGSRMVVTGIGNSTYEPNRSITRAECAAIVIRGMGLQQGKVESTFGDVSLSDWFNGYVDTATAYGLIKGYSDIDFGPNDTITREQAMAILARAMKTTGLSVNLTDSEASTTLAKYTDSASISDFAKLGVAACLKSGIVKGTSVNTLSPKADVTRAEVATMIQQLLQKSGLI